METEGGVKIRRIYFPGWQVYRNGIKISDFEKGNGIFIKIIK